MRHISKLLALLPCLAILGGCARSFSETAVADDGSWNRTVKFTIAKEAQMGGEPPKFEDTFVLPAAGWKVVKTTDKDNQIFTATRAAKLGEVISKDIQIKNKKGIICVNEVKVTELAPGKFEYLETIRYIGPDKPDVAEARKWMSPMLAQVLPTGTDQATTNRFVDAMIGEMWHIIFGPSEPLLSQLFFSPDLAERRMKAKFGRALDTLLNKEFGDKMDANARLKAIRTLIAQLDSGKLLEGSKEKQKEGPSDDSNLIAMFTAVKLPGRIVESNGELDEVSGEVFWAYYPEAAQLGDVTLRAVCEVKP